MQFETQHGPAGTIAICKLEAGDSLVAEGGAFIAMKGPVTIETTTRQKKGGGIWAGIKRILSAESFFLNKFQAMGGPGEVWLGTPLPGDIIVHDLRDEKLVIQGGSYVAAGPHVQIDLEWQGLKSIFSGESLFWIKAKGQGPVVINSFGFIYSVDVDGEYLVDTGHIVAFEETLDFKISKASQSWLGAFLSGEGFVCRFKGRGRVWCQSHNARSFGLELGPHLRPRKN